MVTQCVVVADASRARFFTLVPAADDGSHGGPELVENRDLVNPECELAGKDMFANVKSGRNRVANGPTHGYDDHRDAYRTELERRFAKRVASATAEFARERHAARLLVVVAPRLLGLLREPLARELPDDVSLAELQEDLSAQSPTQIQEVLAKHGFLQARRPPPGIYRPRAQPPPRG